MGLTDDAVIAWAKESTREEAQEVSKVFYDRHAGFLADVVAINASEENLVPIPYRLGDLLALPDDPDAWVVETLVPRKKLIVLASKPKVGKSWIGMDLAYAVATNRQVFGHFSVATPGTVLYLDMEMGMDEFKRRYKLRGQQPGDSASLIAFFETMTLSDSDGLLWFTSVVEEYKPVLVVVDTAAESLGIDDWNHRGQVSRALRPLRHLTRKLDLSILLIAHNRKQIGTGGDEIAGSNAFTGAVDGWLSCKDEPTELPGGGLRAMFDVNNRCGKRGKILLQLDGNTMCCTVADAQEMETEAVERAKNERTERLEQVKKCLLIYNGLITVNHLAAFLSIDARSAQRIIKRYVDEGEIEPTGDKINRSPAYRLNVERKREDQ